MPVPRSLCGCTDRITFSRPGRKRCTYSTRSANSLGVDFCTVEGRFKISFFSGVAPKCSTTEESTSITSRGSLSEKHSGEYSNVTPSPPSSRISASMRKSSISRTAMSTTPLRVVLYTAF